MEYIIHVNQLSMFFRWIFSMENSSVQLLGYPQIAQLEIPNGFSTAEAPPAGVHQIQQFPGVFTWQTLSEIPAQKKWRVFSWGKKKHPLNGITWYNTHYNRGFNQ